MSRCCLVLGALLLAGSSGLAQPTYRPASASLPDSPPVAVPPQMVVPALAVPASPPRPAYSQPASDTAITGPFGPAQIGYDQGFFLTTADDRFSLKINGLSQNRAVFNHRDGNVTGPATQETWDYENTRNALNFSGNVAGDGYYNVRLLVGAYQTNASLDWAYGGWDFEEGFSFSLGQMHLPSTREWIVNDEFQLLTARTWTMGSLYRSGTALQAGYTTDRWRINGYLGNGQAGQAGEMGTLTESYARNNNTVSVGGRFEYIAWTGACGSQPSMGPDASGRLTRGPFARFNQLTSPPGAAEGLLLGGWINYGTTRIYNRNPGAPFLTGDGWQFVLDAQAQLGGSALYGVLWLTPTKIEGRGNLAAYREDVAPWGFMVQAATYLTERVELFGRYEYGDYDGGFLTSYARQPDTVASILTMGANWYLGGQNLKLTTDVGYSFLPLANPTNNSVINSTNWLTDAPMQTGQFLMRAQVQLYF